MVDENMVRRTKERNCWLMYDSVRKDDNGGDRLKEFDLNLIARVGGLLISRPVNSSLSHKESLEKCTEHAKLWLANADQPIGAASTITYAGLRKMINRIMASPYFTTTPAAAAGNVNTNGSPQRSPVPRPKHIPRQKPIPRRSPVPRLPSGKNQCPDGNTYPGCPPYPGGHPYPGFLPYPDNANVGTGRPLTPQASQNYYQFCYGWGYDPHYGGGVYWPSMLGTPPVWANPCFGWGYNPHYGGEIYRPSMLGTPPVRADATLFQRPIQSGEPSSSKEDPTPLPKGKGKAVESSQPGLDRH